MQSIPSPTTRSSKQSRSNYLVFSRQNSSLFLSFHWCKHIFSILRWGKIAWQSSFNTFTSKSYLSKFFISDWRISWLYFTFRKLLKRSMEMNKFGYLIIKKKKIGVSFNFSCPSLMKNQKCTMRYPSCKTINRCLSPKCQSNVFVWAKVKRKDFYILLCPENW